jgi:thiosulfate/3-mercaptopyruvate sulfurtransferase
LDVGPVVNVDWWRAHRESVVLADVRFYHDGRPGRAAYEARHIRGAVYVDIDTVLSDASTVAAGRRPLPDPQRFATALGSLGIADDDLVVGYDDVGGTIAARLIWMLRAIGQPATLLDGGLRAVRADETARGAGKPRVPATRRLRPWPQARVADIDDIAAGVGMLIDARASDRFAGGTTGLDPRPGHVPGAVNIPSERLLTSDGCFRPPAELARHFADSGAEFGSDAADVVVSCGSGVIACHLLLAMEYAGLSPARLWPGSFSQWSNRVELPVESVPVAQATNTTTWSAS